MAKGVFGCPILRVLGDGKGKGMSDCVVWRRKRGTDEPGVKQTGETKEIEASTSASRSLLSKGTGQADTTRKEW